MQKVADSFFSAVFTKTKRDEGKWKLERFYNENAKKEKRQSARKRLVKKGPRESEQLMLKNNSVCLHKFGSDVFMQMDSRVDR